MESRFARGYSAYRSQIAELKRHLQSLEQELPRLGLTAEDCGHLLFGASGQSVYNWEGG
jgi:hypothetical protein